MIIARCQTKPNLYGWNKRRYGSADPELLKILKRFEAQQFYPVELIGRPTEMLVKLEQQTYEYEQTEEETKIGRTWVLSKTIVYHTRKKKIVKDYPCRMTTLEAQE